MVGWPLVEVLMAYLEVVKDQAQHAHEIDLQVWAAIAPYAKKDLKPPAIPPILRPQRPKNGRPT